MRLLILLLTAVCAMSAGAAPEPIPAADAIRQRLLTDRPRPAYPYEARKQGLSGRGLFDIEFVPETGRVRRVRVVQSTGHPILDQSVLAAVQQWRAKPHSIRVVRLPVSFVEPQR